MNPVSLYQPKDTFIHEKVDPFTKLTYFLCSLLSAFVVPTLMGAACLLVLNLLWLTVARELKRALKVITGSLILLLTIFIVQGLFYSGNHSLLFAFGTIHVYREGLLFALTISLRVVNMIAASSVLVMTTSPANVMEACVRRGLSPKAGYVVTAIIQVIPTMMSRAATIREAQQSRGLSLDGNVLRRFRAFLPLMGPVVLSSLMSIQDRAMALEVRGFSSRTRKTFFHEERVLPGMTAVRMVMLFLTAGLIVWRIVQ